MTPDIRTALRPDTPAAAVPVATVVVPAFDEEEAIGAVLADLERVLDPSVEIIVVDDGSSDATADIASRHRCRVIRHQQNRGKGAAMVTGAKAALAEVVVFTDADGTYPAVAIPGMVDLMADHDLVRAIRAQTNENTPRVNRLGNRAFDRLLTSFHGLEGTDHLSGLYAIRRSAFLAMDLRSAGFDIEAEIGIRARLTGLRVTTVPIEYFPRMGEKKLRPVKDGSRIVIRIFGMVVLYRPIATFVVPGCILLVVSLAASILLSGGRVAVGTLGLTTNTLITAAFGLLSAQQLITFGIAAAYYRIEAGDRPRPWLLRLGRRNVRLGLAGAGVALGLAGAGWILGLIVSFFAGGATQFGATRPLVLAGVLAVSGLQLLTFGLFLSIFSGPLVPAGADPA